VKPQGTYDALEDLFASTVKSKVQAELQQEFVAEINQAVAR